MSPRSLFAATVFAAAISAGQAGAQVVVLGGGLAAECFRSAEDGQSSRKVEETCTRALNGEILSSANRAATHTNRGVVRMRSGDIDGALQDYDAALRMQPGLGTAFLNRGAALIYAKRWADARQSLDKALERNTTEPHAAYYNRAIARENLGDVQGAYRDFQAALSMKPGWELAERQLGRFEVVQR